MYRKKELIEVLHFNPVEEVFKIKRGQKKYDVEIKTLDCVKQLSVEILIRLVFKRVYEYTPLIKLIYITPDNLDEYINTLNIKASYLISKLLVIKRSSEGVKGDAVLKENVRLSKENQQTLSDLFLLSFLFSMPFSSNNWIMTTSGRIIPVLNIDYYFYREFSSVDIILNDYVGSPFNDNVPSWMTIRKLVLYSSSQMKDFIYTFSDILLKVVKNEAVKLGAKRQYLENVNINDRLKILRNYLEH